MGLHETSANTKLCRRCKDSLPTWSTWVSRLGLDPASCFGTSRTSIEASGRHKQISATDIEQEYWVSTASMIALITSMSSARRCLVGKMRLRLLLLAAAPPYHLRGGAPPRLCGPLRRVVRRCSAGMQPRPSEHQLVHLLRRLPAGFPGKHRLAAPGYVCRICVALGRQRDALRGDATARSGLDWRACQPHRAAHRRMGSTSYPHQRYRILGGAGRQAPEESRPSHQGARLLDIHEGETGRRRRRCLGVDQPSDRGHDEAMALRADGQLLGARSLGPRQPTGHHVVLLRRGQGREACEGDVDTCRLVFPERSERVATSSGDWATSNLWTLFRPSFEKQELV